MAMNRIRVLLPVLAIFTSGCAWIGLAEEKTVYDFDIPEKGAMTLIKDVSERTANVDFNTWYLEVLPHPVVRVEGKAVTTTAMKSLQNRMESVVEFKNVSSEWGSLSKYDEVNFGLRGRVSVEMRQDIPVEPWNILDGAGLLKKILSRDSTVEFEESLVSIPIAIHEWENGWRCEVVEIRYNPGKLNRLPLQEFLDIMKEAEIRSATVRAVIARLWLEDGRVSRSIVRWNCYLPPAD